MAYGRPEKKLINISMCYPMKGGYKNDRMEMQQMWIHPKD
jgi:hypothetical protein